MRDPVRDPVHAEVALHRGEVPAARLAQEIDRVWQPVDDGLVLGHLAVEDPEGVRLGAPLAVAAEPADIFAERRDQGLAERGTARRAAHRVHDQFDAGDAQLPDQRPREVEHLGVDRRVRDAEDLDVELMELAVPALLRPLVPEHRAEQVHLRRRHRLLEAVLDKRAHEARRRLGAQGDALAPLVGEGVHLLLDDVGRLARALGEQFLAFDDRRADLGVAVALEEPPRHRLHALPALHLARQDVVGSPDRWNHAPLRPASPLE